MRWTQFILLIAIPTHIVISAT